MTQDIVILGAGGHAKEIAFLIEDINMEKMTWDLLGYIDKDKSNMGKTNGKYEIIGDNSYFNDNNNKMYVVIAVGSPTKIKIIYEQLLAFHPNLKSPNLIHPSVIRYMRNVTLGQGNVICAGNIFTTDIEIGSYNSINRGCNISHDVKICDYCIINPGVNISGGVLVKSCCLVGTGATILQYLTIYNHSTVGAGAVVTKDVEPGKTVVGVPAKPKR